jgi:TonB family protein
MLNNSYMPLRGKPSLPMLIRHTHPSTKLIEGSALLEGALFTLNPDRRAVLRFVQKKERESIGIADLISYYRDLLQPVEDLVEANRIRNQWVHSAERGGPPPTLKDLENAAETIIATVHRLLPHLPASARELALADPHESLECLTVADASQLPTYAARISALIARQDALLSRLDREENRPAYDLTSDRTRATPRERFERHRALFTPATQAGVLEAFKLTDQSFTADKEFHLRKKLQNAESFLKIAIELLERRFGIYVELEPVAEALEPAPPEEASGPVAVHLPEDVTVSETVPEPVVEKMPESIVEQVAKSDQKPTNEPGQVVVRVRFPRKSARLLARLTAGFGLVASAVLGLQMESGIASAKAEVKVASRGVPASLVYWRRPEWTPEALSAHVEGDVLLRVQVDETGRTESARVEQGPGYGLEAKAIEAVSHWRFSGHRRVIPVTVHFGKETE